MFFIFKQKTAYEMRISDWSSDMCCSDLQHELVRSEPQDLNRLVQILGQAFVHRPFSSCYGPHQRSKSKARTRVREHFLPVTGTWASVEPECLPTFRCRQIPLPKACRILSALMGNTAATNVGPPARIGMH